MSEFIQRFSLTGKTALVTGASKGIGKEICRVLADAGADIVAVARDPRPEVLTDPASFERVPSAPKFDDAAGIASERWKAFHETTEMVDPIIQRSASLIYDDFSWQRSQSTIDTYIKQLLSDALAANRAFDAILVLDVSRCGRVQNPIKPDTTSSCVGRQGSASFIAPNRSGKMLRPLRPSSNI